MKKRRSTIPDTEEDPFEPSLLEKERCMNPWNGKCTSTDIALYIMHKDRRLPICRKCWISISAKDIEWRYD